MSKRLSKVEFTNLDKVLYPALRITKAKVIEYYIRIAPNVLELLFNRPAVLTRFPDGVNKEGFYEKDAPLGTPAWVKTSKRFSKSAQREVAYILCNDLDTLIWLANLAALEIHMTLSKADSFERPDFVLFDIDPEPPASFNNAISIALLLKDKLDELSLRSYAKTSGKKGLHVVIPIVNEYSYQQTREFVHQVGKQLTRESGIVVSEFSQSRDPGTVFLDYLQNSHGRTMICPYSLRATPQATVSTPLDWKDVKEGLKPEEFNLLTIARLEKNPWEGLLEDRQRLEVS